MASKVCWHCQDTRKCDCIACGYSALVNNTIVQKAGVCGWCEAREFIERHRDVLDRFETTDRRNWQYFPGHDGNKARRLFIPFEGLK